MDISVILCTYNRCQSLAMALESLEASVLPTTSEWELLIVDNNSKDATRQVAERFCERNPQRFRYLFEANQGKSCALNAGIRNAHGEILAFVDDDVTVVPGWLYNLTSDLNSGEWAGAGGRILLPAGFSPPRWLALEGPLRQGAALCAHFDFGDLPGELKEAPYGTNMAYRKEMFTRYGGFRIDLGPRPGSELRNEDTEFGGRVLAGGERLRYVPSAVVYHPVPEERVRKGFFRARWFAVGRSQMRERAGDKGIGNPARLPQSSANFPSSLNFGTRFMLVILRRGSAVNAMHGIRLAGWRKYGTRLFEGKPLAQVSRSRGAVPFYSAIASVDFARGTGISKSRHSWELYKMDFGATVSSNSCYQAPAS